MTPLKSAPRTSKSGAIPESPSALRRPRPTQGPRQPPHRGREHGRAGPGAGELDLRFLACRLGGMTPYGGDDRRRPRRQAWVDFNLEFKLDAWSARFYRTTRTGVFESIDYRLYSWPGHGVAKEVGISVQRERVDASRGVRASDCRSVGLYASRVSTPPPWGPSPVSPTCRRSSTTSNCRSCREHGGGVGLAGDGRRPCESHEGRRPGRRWAQATFAKIGDSMGLGFPAYWGGATKAPFDILGDTAAGHQRGRRRHVPPPDKVLAACDRLTQVAIDFRHAATRGGRPRRSSSCPFTKAPTVS